MGKAATPPKFNDKQAGATAKFIRVPPRKARLVIDAVRGKYVTDALAVLKFVPNFAARAIEDVLQSAVANAENSRPVSEETGKQLPPLIAENLKLVRAFVDEGPRIKRLQPRAQGRAYRIVKRMCHISVIVEEVAPKPKKTRKPKTRRTQAAQTRPAVTRPAAKKTSEKPEETAPAAVEETPIVEGTAPVEVTAPVEETAPAVEETTAQAEERAAEPAAEERAAEAAAGEAPAAEAEAAGETPAKQGNEEKHE